jgi:hypothetical protein
VNQARFCQSCGTPSDTHSQASTSATVKASRRSRLPLYIVAAVASVTLLVVIGAMNSEPVKVTENKIGDTVSVGYWTYVCNGASWRQSIGSEYSRQIPDAEFLVVDLTILNNDKTASVLAPLKLVDEQGREYDESSKRMFMDSSFGLLKTLNPGVSSHGYAIFDVPHSKYALRVSGGFGSGESQSIALQYSPK